MFFSIFTISLFTLFALEWILIHVCKNIPIFSKIPTYSFNLENFVVSRAMFEQCQREVISLKEMLFLTKSSVKRLEAQLRQLMKKKDSLVESVKVLKKDLWSEKQARFVTENTLMERVKTLEMELEFKETEFEEYKQKTDQERGEREHAIDDEDDEWLYQGINDLDGGIGDERVSSPSIDVESIISASTFQTESRKHVYHHFVCNVSAASVIVDLDDLMIKYGASMDDCVLVTFECLLDFVEKRGAQGVSVQQVSLFLGTLKHFKAFSKYSRVILHFLEVWFPKSKILDVLLAN